MRRRFHLLSATTALSVLACSGAALAQTAAPQAAATATPAPDSQDIVVTAQRRQQNLQNTPIAVSAFNSEMLKVRAVNDVIAIASSTPGLYISQGTASPSTLQVAMRGALEQNGGTITSESPVAIYIDDVYQSRLSAADYDLADIERVEVLRGPQGTLYGRNSMTGAIKLITRQPDGSTWLTGDVSLARFSEVKVKATAGAPIGDHLAFAASGFYDDRAHGWQYDETLKTDVSKFKRYGGQLALGITNVPGLEAVLTGRYLKSDSDGQHFLPITDAPPYKPSVPFYDTLTPQQGIGDNTQKAVSLHLGYDLGGVKLRSTTAYQTLSEHWGLDFAGGYIQPDGTVTVGFYRDAVSGQHQFSQEFQALGKAFDNKLNYIFGAYYFDESSHETNLDNLASFGLTYLPETLDMQSKSLAFYGQADYELTSKLTASVGVRYTRDHKYFEGMTQNGFISELVPVADRISANVVTPRFNLQYNANSHLMLYGTISRGYRAAGFNSLVIADPADFGAAYKPEFSWSYEVGAKLDTFDHMLRFNLATYYEKLSNLQTLADAGTGSFIIQNAANAKVEGVELESTFNPVKGLSFFGNLTYTYDKYGALAASSEAAQDGATRLPLISRWQYQIGGSYEMPLGPDVGSLQLAGDYNYRSGYFSLVSLAPSSFNPGIGRANATLTYKTPGDHWEVYAQATNLFDKKNWVGSAEFIPGVFGYKIPLEPRVWRIGLRYKM